MKMLENVRFDLNFANFNSPLNEVILEEGY